MKKPVILMVEDDTRLAKMVGHYLQHESMDFIHKPNGVLGLAMLLPAVDAKADIFSPTIQSQLAIDLVILDLMLPDTDGLSFCRTLRTSSNAAAHTPVLMLTAKGDPVDKIVGLELGADDYMSKPFEPRELLARIRAILRRPAQQLASQSISKAIADSTANRQLLVFENIHIDADARTTKANGKHVDLTAHQFNILWILASQSGKVMTRESIMQRLQGKALEAFDRSIDVHIGHIRNAIEPNPKEPQRIVTVRGVGYVFVKHLGL